METLRQLLPQSSLRPLVCTLPQLESSLLLDPPWVGGDHPGPTCLPPNGTRPALALYINVAQHTSRRRHVEAAIAPLLLPRVPVERVEAATPAATGCPLPPLRPVVRKREGARKRGADDCLSKSHFDAWRRIVRRAEVAEDAWGCALWEDASAPRLSISRPRACRLILEDDVDIHPDLQPGRFADVVDARLRYAELANAPLVYLALCRPTASAPTPGAPGDPLGPVSRLGYPTRWRDYWRRQISQQPFAPRTAPRLAAGRCRGYCTTAYALQKRHAVSLPMCGS